MALFDSKPGTQLTLTAVVLCLFTWIAIGGNGIPKNKMKMIAEIELTHIRPEIRGGELHHSIVWHKRETNIAMRINYFVSRIVRS